MKELDIRRETIEGLPVHWAEHDGPTMASLSFRVGTADEPVALRGITHLVEHLALFELGRRPYEYNGWVEDTQTIFAAEGELDEVLEFLRLVCAGLTNPPLERLETERRVLRAEAAGRESGSERWLKRLRYGGAGYGVSVMKEFALRWAGADELGAWIERYFTRGNAAIWLTAPPPAGLDLELPGGERRPPPAPRAIPRLELPAERREDEGEIGLLIEGERSEAFSAVTRIARERLHERLRRELGIAYDIAPGAEYLDGRRRGVTYLVSCADADAERARDELVAVLEQLAADGPNEAELDAEREAMRRFFADPEAAFSELDIGVRDELHGAPSHSREDVERAYAELTPAACAAVFADAWRTALLVVPEKVDGPPPSGFRRYSVGERPPVRPEGDTFREKDTSTCIHRPCEVVIGDEQLYWRAGDASGELSAYYEDLTAVIRDAGDRYTLYEPGGWRFEFNPCGYHDEDRLRALIAERAGDQRIVPVDARAAEIDALARRTLPWMEAVTRELYQLWRLTEGEQGRLLLAEATAASEQVETPGLLALTERSVWHLYDDPRDAALDHLTEIPLTAIVRAEAGADSGQDAGRLRLHLEREEAPYEVRGIRPAAVAGEIERAIAERVGAEVAS